MKTLDLYKKLFVTPCNFNDMYFMKHAREFREKYTDCPRPKKVDLLELEVSYDTAKHWKNEDGELPDLFRTAVSDEFADLIIDREVLEYIDKNVTDPELRENITSCISPLRPVQSVVFHAADSFWHFMVRVDQMSTNLSHDTRFWEEYWEEDACDEGNVFVYFAWSKVLDTTMAKVKTCKNYVEHNTVLMRWNPKESTVTKEDFNKYLTAVNNGEKITLSWPTFEYDRVNIGDKVYILRIGNMLSGIVAKGTITSKPYLSEDKSGQHYVDFVVETMFNPDGKLVNLDGYGLIGEAVDWNKKQSGIVVENNEIKDYIDRYYDLYYTEDISTMHPKVGGKHKS